MGPPSERTRLRRRAERRYERETVDAILDEAPFCFVGFTTPEGPAVVPTIHARDGDTLYLHGSTASRMLTAARDADVCVAVAILDGLVVARSVFHHSMNYRAAVVYGRAREVAGTAEKERALRALVEHVLPGRSAEARPPSPKELAATLVLAVPLDEAAAKVRTGPPVDDPEDVGLPIWAGVVPLWLVRGPAEPDAGLAAGVPVPPSVAALDGTR